MNRVERRVAMGLVLVTVMGCASTSSVTRTSYAFEREPLAPKEWLRIETPDFVLNTDLDPLAAEQAAQMLGQALVGLTSMFGKAPVLAPTKITVFAFSDGVDFERRFGKRTWGFAVSSYREAYVFLYGQPERWFVRDTLAYESSESVLQHELAHVILRRYFPEQPQWFAEGLAQYLETFRWLDSTTVRLGDMSLAAYRRYRMFRSLTIADMLSWHTVAQRETVVEGMYGLSWAFVHFAINRMPKEFGTYMGLLAQKGAAAAWENTFAHASELDQQVFKYISIGAYEVKVIKAPISNPVRAVLKSQTPAQRTEMYEVFSKQQEVMRAHNGS